MAYIVQPGLDKLETYKEHANLVLAYVVTMNLHSAITNLQNTASYQPHNRA